MTSPWLDIKAAAAYIRTTPWGLRKLVALRDVAYCRRGPGKRAPLMFHREDLDAFLMRRRVEVERFQMRRGA